MSFENCEGAISTSGLGNGTVDSPFDGYISSTSPIAYDFPSGEVYIKLGTQIHLYLDGATMDEPQVDSGFGFSISEERRAFYVVGTAEKIGTCKASTLTIHIVGDFPNLEFLSSPRTGEIAYMGAS